MVVEVRSWILQLKTCQNAGWDIVGGLTTS